MCFVGGIFQKWHRYERMFSDTQRTFIHCTVLGKLMFVYAMKLMQWTTLHKGVTTNINLVHYRWKGNLMSKRFTETHLMPKLFNFLRQLKKIQYSENISHRVLRFAAAQVGSVRTRFRSSVLWTAVTCRLLADKNMLQHVHRGPNNFNQPQTLNCGSSLWRHVTDKRARGTYTMLC